jgi:hypothetical protein
MTAAPSSLPLICRERVRVGSVAVKILVLLKGEKE